MPKITAIAAGAALVLASLYFFAGRDAFTGPVVTASIPAQAPVAKAPAPELPLESVPQETMENISPPTKKQNAVATISALTGRVFDARSGQGIAQAVLTAESTAGATAFFEARTDADGTYRLDGVPEGTYTLAIDAIDGYPETSSPGVEKEVIVDLRATTIVEDFPLTAGGVLEGTFTAAGKPLVNDVFSFSQEFDSPEFGPFTVNTDHLGGYRLTGLDGHEGIIVASRTRSDGTSQTSTRKKVVIVPGETTTANFSFPEGRASAEGHIYYVDESNPVPANIYAYYYVVRGDGGPDIQEIYAETDEHGYYLIENLPEGVLSLQVNPTIPDMNAVTNEVILYEGERSVKDIVIADFVVNCVLLHIPEGTGHLVVSAEEGRKPPIAKLTMLDFVNAQGETVSFDHVAMNSDTPSATLKGLKPGEYTIRASSFPLPATWNPETWAAMGWDKFLAGIVATRVYITVESMSGSMDVTLDFDNRDRREPYKEPSN